MHKQIISSENASQILERKNKVNEQSNPYMKKALTLNTPINR